MRLFTIILGCAALVTSAACGKSAEEKQAEEAAKAAQQGAQQVAQGADAVAKGLAQMAQGAAAGNVQVVQFEELQKSLPEISGWTRAEPTGTSTAIPFPMSQTSADYRKGDEEIEISIVDTALNQVLFAPFSMYLVAGYNERTSDGFRRGTTIKGEPGFEEWSSGGKSGNVTALVGKRFIVSAKGQNVTGIEPVRGAIERIDFGKLAASK